MNRNKPLKVLVIGAGIRGMYVYGELSKKEDINMEIVGVAEPVEEKRKKMAREHNISDSNCFKTGEEALSVPKFCDAVINTTPDRIHHKISLAALEKKYHLLLEKPMAASAKECIEIVNAQKKSGTVLMVCHLLRYASLFQKLKKIIDARELGKIHSIDLLEEIGYWHYAHSFVRGNWRKKSESGPVILTKSCHDLDLLSWFIDSEIKSIHSTGSLKYFTKKNAPKGSTLRCVDKCKIKKKCPYNAEKFYLSEKNPENVKWPSIVISPVDKSIKARKKELNIGNYGRCVFKCDNNVCDNQEVLIRFENGINARFILTAFGPLSTRKIKIYSERGEIHGDLKQGSIRIIKYSGLKEQDELQQIDVISKDSHGGGDSALLKNFIKSIQEKDEKYNLTSAEKSLRSHLIAFAAEESRMKGKSINFKKYNSKLRKQ
jgi:predicted dehydrogenase